MSKTQHITETVCATGLDLVLFLQLIMEVRRSGRSRRRIDYAALHSSHVLQEVNKHPHIDSFEEFPMEYPLSDVVYIVDKEFTQDIDFTDDNLKSIVNETKLLKPILVRGANPNITETYNSKIKLSFNIPNYDIDQMTDMIGAERKVPVMDVMTQNNSMIKWDMDKWRKYFKSDPKEKLQNVISLEISDSKLGSEIEIPKIVEEIDLIKTLFEKNSEFKETLLENGILPPKVLKYILMSVAGSYTDFHIDFAGTSVYYSPVSGHKKFILIPPLKRNLDVYKKWCLSDDQNKVWFPSLLKPLSKSDINRMTGTVPESFLNNGFLIDIYPGDLLLLPSSWIHAVYTKQDSIIIGGNFLNLLSLESHLQTYKLEVDTKVNDQFKFPNFVKYIWLVAYSMYENKYMPTSTHELNCILSLIDFLNEQWQFVDSIQRKISEKKTAEYTKSDKLSMSKIKQAIPSEIVGSIPSFLEELDAWKDSICVKEEKVSE